MSDTFGLAALRHCGVKSILVGGNSWDGAEEGEQTGDKVNPNPQPTKDDFDQYTLDLEGL